LDFNDEALRTIHHRNPRIPFEDDGQPTPAAPTAYYT
jgi:hypothetical protein